MTVQVLIIDDSTSMRRLVRHVLEQDPRLTVIGEAESAEMARPMIKALNPDVLTLDIEMPGIGGIEFLKRLMRLRPMPVVMVSSLTREGSDHAIQALGFGAVDCVAKPGVDRSHFPDDFADRVYYAAKAKRQPRISNQAAPNRPCPAFHWNGRFLLIGASTGGVEAIERVLSAFPSNCPPTLITQHMPESYLRSFASRLDSAARPNVSLATEGAPLAQGNVFLAPGGKHHLAASRLGLGKTAMRLFEGERRSGHRPSVDHLFSSALSFAPEVTAVLLTGMGRDGAEGLLELKTAGAYTIAQNEESCIVFGMPRVAINMGAAIEICPLDQIAERALATCSKSIPAEQV